MQERRPSESAKVQVTPTSASWLNLIECWFSRLNRRRLERGAFTSTAALEAAINAYIAENNADPKPFVWTKSRRRRRRQRRPFLPAYSQLRPQAGRFYTPYILCIAGAAGVYLEMMLYARTR
jgi:hypothetical protein